MEKQLLSSSFSQAFEPEFPFPSENAFIQDEIAHLHEHQVSSIARERNTLLQWHSNARCLHGAVLLTLKLPLLWVNGKFAETTSLG